MLPSRGVILVGCYVAMQNRVQSLCSTPSYARVSCSVVDDYIVLVTDVGSREFDSHADAH